MDWLEGRTPLMPPMDYRQFENWLKRAGYTIGRSTKHHVVLDSNGKVVARFAVAHKNGGKTFVKDCYNEPDQKEPRTTMNIESIKLTAVHRVDENGDHIVQSPLCDDIIGAGDTEAEAWKIFYELLEDYVDDYRAGRLAVGPGRPRKGKIKFSVEIAPDVREAVAALAKKLKISQGEAVECLFRTSPLKDQVNAPMPLKFISFLKEKIEEQTKIEILGAFESEDEAIKAANIDLRPNQWTEVKTIVIDDYTPAELRVIKKGENVFWV